VKRVLTFLGALTVMWAFLVGLVILNTGVPKNRAHWIIAVIAGPPIYIAAEAFFDWMFSKEHGDKISAKPFSLLRILLALVAMLVIFGALVTP
jgi:hypothetical protein